MIKPWILVEQSTAYQNLSPQAKTQSKKEYWNTIIANKPEYATLDAKSQASARQEFFGGELAENAQIGPTNQFMSFVSGQPFAGNVSPRAYQSGQRSLLGNISERPAAAIRAFIQNLPPGGKSPMQAYQEASVNPTNVPRFQDLALNNLYSTNLPLPLKIAIGNQVSAAGLGADIATNPSDLLGMIVGKAPIGGRIAPNVARQIGRSRVTARELVGRLKPVQAITRFGAKERQLPVLFPNEVQKTAQLNETLNKTILQGISKGVRPSVSGKGTINKSAQYFQNAKNGIVEIIQNKNNLGFLDEIGNPVIKTPETLTEYAQAIESTKEKIFSEYSALAKQAGEAGAKFNSTPIVRNLKSVANDVKHNPQVRQYALNLVDDIAELQGADPLTIQARVKDLNRNLINYYAGRVDKAKAELDASVANLMRNQLDSSIEKVTGQQYQPLKNAYGALKSVEKDVNHRAIVAMRAAPKNVFDLVDTFSGGRITYGILTANPAEVAAGLVQTGMKNVFKRLNNPDRVISVMFKNAERLLNKMSVSPITPEILEDIPFSRQGTLPYRQPLRLPNKQLLLPSPKNVPYQPMGYPGNVPPQKPLITPQPQGGPAIPAGQGTWEEILQRQRIGEAQRLKKALEKFKQGKYRKQIRMKFYKSL